MLRPPALLTLIADSASCFCLIHTRFLLFPMSLRMLLFTYRHGAAFEKSNFQEWPFAGFSDIVCLERT